MIPIANALMYTGLTVGLLGILSGVILVYRALRDRWERRHTNAGLISNESVFPRRTVERFTTHNLTRLNR